MKNKRVLNIAIDGPSGAGKSTISKLLAEKLGVIHIDTGAMYRCISLFLLNNNIDINDEKEVSNKLNDINIRLEDGQVFLNGSNVTEEIRDPYVTKSVSKVSSYRDVRKRLVDMQRKIASENSCVMDGRDIGTTVLKNADLKIFLTATAEKRADRRFLELRKKGIKINYSDVLKDILIRDDYDSKREISPLRKDKEAIEVDTTDFTIDEVVNRILKIMEQENVI